MAVQETRPSPPPRSGKGEPVAQPALGFTGWLRFVWRQLTSMKTALLLLLLLAVAAVPGSIFPQRRVDASRVDLYLSEHRSSGPWLDRLGLFDVYSSPWFAAVYLLLFISLVGCVVPRMRQHLKASRARPPRAPRRFERLPAHAVQELDDRDPAASASASAGRSPDEVAARARDVLRRHRYRVVVDVEAGPDRDGPDGDGDAGDGDAGDGGSSSVSVAAERGYVAEWGNLAFHLALLGLLVAVAVGSLFSWSGQTIVVEGKGFSNSLPMFSSFRPGASVDVADLPPFSFGLDKLTVRFEEDDLNALGSPRHFRADVTVRETPDSPPQAKAIEVNHPLDLAGTRIYLVGNGYAPVITVRDGEGNVSFRGPVTFRVQDAQYTSLGVVKVPDARPKQIGLVGVFLPTALVDPQDRPFSVFPDARDPKLVLNAYVGDPSSDDLGSTRNQSVFELDTDDLTPLKAPDGTPLRLVLAPGESAELPDGAGSVTFESLPRYAAFDLHRDPSRGWALLWAVVAVTGLMLSLFARRRRVWVRAEVEAGEAGEDRAGRRVTVVRVGGLARGDDLGLEEHVKDLMAEIAQDHGQRTHRPPSEE